MHNTLIFRMTLTTGPNSLILSHNVYYIYIYRYHNIRYLLTKLIKCNNTSWLMTFWIVGKMATYKCTPTVCGAAVDRVYPSSSYLYSHVWVCDVLNWYIAHNFIVFPNIAGGGKKISVSDMIFFTGHRDIIQLCQVPVLIYCNLWCWVNFMVSFYCVS